MQHDIFSRNTRNQLRQLFEARRELTALPEAAPKQPVGFIHPKNSRTRLPICESNRACHGLDACAWDDITEFNLLLI